MIFFAFYEEFVNILLLVCINIFFKEAYFLYELLFLGFGSFFQSIGIIYFKPTRDPLERISYLGYMNLVSINQRIN